MTTNKINIWILIGFYPKKIDTTAQGKHFYSACKSVCEDIEGLCIIIGYSNFTWQHGGME